MVEHQISQSVTITAETPKIEFAFKPGERRHPHRVVQRLYREGRYLVDLPSQIPVGAQSSLGELMDLYRPHIGIYDKSSVAQLCPSKSDFECLTIDGIDLVYPGKMLTETVFVNTTDQLRGVLDQLKDNPKIRVFTHRRSSKDPWRRRDLTQMKRLLSDWDALSEEPMPQALQ